MKRWCRVFKNFGLPRRVASIQKIIGLQKPIQCAYFVWENQEKTPMEKQKCKFQFSGIQKAKNCAQVFGKQVMYAITPNIAMNKTI